MLSAVRSSPHENTCIGILPHRKHNRGLGGFTFVETPVEPYIRDFCTGEDESVTRWERFDLSNWAFFMAFDGERPVGGATVVSRTKDVNMFVDTSEIMFDQGNRTMYLSKDGSATVIIENRHLISAYSKEYFDPAIKAILEVLNHA